jgi:hypothetical protein
MIYQLYSVADQDAKHKKKNKGILGKENYD